MTDTLYKLTLLHLSHKDNHIFFTGDGDALYGKDENNLAYPHGLQIQHKFPPIFVEDLQNAFKLGMKAGIVIVGTIIAKGENNDQGI